MKFFNTDTLIDNLFIFLCLLLLGLPLFASVFSAEIIGGWDGVSHVAMAEDYARFTWPAVHGWTPNWYLGMPFPNFYHPLFFWLVALFYKITPFTMPFIVKWFVLFLTFLLPHLSYRVTYKYCHGRYAGLVAGFLSVFFMTRSTNISDKRSPRSVATCRAEPGGSDRR